MSLRLVQLTLFALAACAVSVSSLAAPDRLVITRHGEKLDTWQLCQIGLDRAQALSDQYLGAHATESLFPNEPPAAIMTLTIHTSETAEPTAYSRAMPTTNYLALPNSNLSVSEFEAEINRQNRQAVHDLMNNPLYKGKQILMFWEHFHTASAALESRYPGEQVTLRQLLKLNQPPFAKQVPATWPDSNYNFLWIVDFNPDGSIKAFSTKRQVYQGRYANLPNNDWDAPEGLPSNSHCINN